MKGNDYEETHWISLAFSENISQKIKQWTCENTTISDENKIKYALKWPMYLFNSLRAGKFKGETHCILKIAY